MAPRTSSWSVWNNLESTDYSMRSPDDWIKARYKEDGAEELWRVHDGLYDLQSWIKNHPGGSQWLEITKGIDITELFESHHLNMNKVTEVMSKFYVRQAVTPRKSPFTFEPNGFYNTLKSRVVKQLSLVNPDNYTVKSMLVVDTYILVALALCLSFSLLKNNIHNYILAVFIGIILGLGTIASHNFSHLKDNWRMYYMQLSLVSVREFRISHILSHHIFTNTIQDLEMIMLYPFIHWFPTDDKPLIVRFFPFLTPFAYPVATSVQLILRTLKGNNDKSDIMIFIIPALLMLFGQMTIINTLILWLIIEMASSFMFLSLGFIASHHFPDNFHDGDNVSGEYVDWGLHQMYSSVERSEPINNIFMTMATFSDHSLHHLFPALDHSLIPVIKETFDETCKEFGLDITPISIGTVVRGQFKQLVRLVPNDPKGI